MKINQLTASAFADEIGVQRSSVSHVLSGRNKPSLEFIQKVLKRFPKVDGNWLISGSTQIEKEKIEVDGDVKVKKADESKTSNIGKQHLSTKESKDVQRIIVFYSDNTFEEYKPS